MNHQHRKPATIRFQLLTTVNVVFALFVTTALTYDYHREISERLEMKRISLEDEAKILALAVSEISQHRRDRIQQYIDSVCALMQESYSPGHHIVVEVDGEFIQATAHHRDSAEILDAVRRAAPPDFRSSLGQSELVVGTFIVRDITVYVSETVDNLYRSVVGDIFRRLIGFFVLALVAAIVINLALTRIVAQPLDTLVSTVRKIKERQLGVQSDSLRSAELNYLGSEINAMSESLAVVDRERAIQMTKAREIQRNLLPTEIDIDGLNIAYCFEPADDIGGDYYDVLSNDDGSALFCVADVTGHGVSAAMTAAMLKALLNQSASLFASPSLMLDFINRSLIDINPSGDFVTMFLARISPEEKRIQYASAGHELAWLRGASGEVQEMNSTGLILGVTVDANWSDESIDFPKFSRLLVATDGVSETYDEQGEMFGRQAVAQSFAELADFSTEEVTSLLNKRLIQFRGDGQQHDDVTIVVVELAPGQISRTED